MYSKIQAMKAEGFSIRQVSRIIRVSRNTITKYWEMEPEEYAKKYKAANRLTALTAYEPTVVKWLETYPCMTAAQVRDWLEERHQLDASERTVRRLVSRLRAAHGIEKKTEPRREYEAVEELPKGQQIQLDMGEKTVRDAYSSRYIKLYFGVFTLTYSRYKWGCFQDRPFTSADMVSALYGCFEYIGGMPRQLVYDQDSILVVSENNGDIIHTKTFTAFLTESKLEVRVCRKNDPESKGLIEASVKFVKGNFMENRLYMGIDTWNRSFEEWLERTGNRKEHGTTKRKPAEMFMEEQAHLLPLYGTAPTETIEDGMERAVRPDNTIIYRSNRYSVPYGTYGNLKTVALLPDGNKLTIMDNAGENIAIHEISKEKGKLIKAETHKRDKGEKIAERLNKTVSLLGEEFREYLTIMCGQKPRYVKEQLKLVTDACEKYGREHVLVAMEYCQQRDLYGASDLNGAAGALCEHEHTVTQIIRLPLMRDYQQTSSSERYHVNVQKRELSVYTQVAVGNEAGI